MYVYVCICICLYFYMYIYVYICIYVYVGWVCMYIFLLVYILYIYLFLIDKNPFLVPFYLTYYVPWRACRVGYFGVALHIPLLIGCIAIFISFHRKISVFLQWLYPVLAYTMFRPGLVAGVLSLTVFPHVGLSALVDLASG